MAGKPRRDHAFGLGLARQIDDADLGSRRAERSIGDPPEPVAVSLVHQQAAARSCESRLRKERARARSRRDQPVLERWQHVLARGVLYDALTRIQKARIAQPR